MTSSELDELITGLQLLREEGRYAKKDYVLAVLLVEIIKRLDGQRI